MTPVDRPRTPADRLLRAGAVLTLAGLAAIALSILLLVAWSAPVRAVMWLSALVAVCGLVTVLAGLVVSARSRRGSGR